MKLNDDYYVYGSTFDSLGFSGSPYVGTEISSFCPIGEGDFSTTGGFGSLKDIPEPYGPVII